MVSSLSAFLGEIGRHQLLTPEQELTMGRKVQAMVALTERCHLAGGSGPACCFNDEEKRTIKRGEKAKNQMIASSRSWSTWQSGTKARVLTFLTSFKSTLIDACVENMT